VTQLPNFSTGLNINLKNYEKTLTEMTQTHVLEKQKLQKSIDKLLESKETLKNELELNNKLLSKTNVELKIKNKIEEKSFALQKTIEQLQESEKELQKENKNLSNKIASLETEILDLKRQLNEKRKQIFNDISSISNNDKTFGKSSSHQNLEKPSSFLNISTPRRVNDESANEVANAFTNETTSENTANKRLHHRKRHSHRNAGEESSTKHKSENKNSEKNNSEIAEKNQEKEDKSDLENSTSTSGSQRRRRRRTHSSSSLLSNNTKNDSSLVSEHNSSSSFIIETVFDIDDANDFDEKVIEKDSSDYFLPKTSSEKDSQREIHANETQRLHTLTEEKNKIEKKNNALKKTVENHAATIKIMQEKIDSQIVLIETMLASSKENDAWIENLKKSNGKQRHAAAL
jgi:hypothetical protein